MGASISIGVELNHLESFQEGGTIIYRSKKEEKPILSTLLNDKNIFLKLFIISYELPKWNFYFFKLRH